MIEEAATNKEYELSFIEIKVDIIASAMMIFFYFPKPIKSYSVNLVRLSFSDSIYQISLLPEGPAPS